MNMAHTHTHTHKAHKKHSLWPWRHMLCCRQIRETGPLPGCESLILRTQTHTLNTLHPHVHVQSELQHHQGHIHNAAHLMYPHLYHLHGSFSYAKLRLCLSEHTVLWSVEHTEHGQILTQQAASCISQLILMEFFWELYLAWCHLTQYLFTGLESTNCSSVAFLKGEFQKHHKTCLLTSPTAAV